MMQLFASFLCTFVKHLIKKNNSNQIFNIINNPSNKMEKRKKKLFLLCCYVYFIASSTMTSDFSLLQHELFREMLDFCKTK